MQEFSIFGIHVKDYTQKESLHLLGEYLNNGGLNTVSYLNTQMLIDSEKDEQCQEWLNSLDMTIVAEPEIIKASGQADYSRLKEVETGFILKSLVHKITKQKLTTYLITDNAVGMMELERGLRQMQPSMKVGGRFVLEEEMLLTSHEDAMVNDINDIAPTVIISRLPFKQQVRLMADNRRRINAELWLGLLYNVSLHGTRIKHSGFLNSFFYKRLFSRKVAKYYGNRNEQH